MSSFYPLENSVERLVPRSSDTSTPDRIMEYVKFPIEYHTRMIGFIFSLFSGTILSIVRFGKTFR